MIDPLVAAYLEKLRASGIPADRVNREAGVPNSTPWRWEHRGVSPSLVTLRRLEETLDRLIAAKRDAAA